MEAYGGARGGCYIFQNSGSGYIDGPCAFVHSRQTISRDRSLELRRRAIEQGSVPITQDHNDCAVEYVSGRAAHRLSATAA